MITILQQSSLEKIFLNQREFQPPYLRGSTLRGERFAFQVVLRHDGWGSCPVELSVNSPLTGHISLYQVEQVPCELAAYPERCDEDYLTTQSGLFPDLLRPLETGKLEISSFGNTVVWVEVFVPEDWEAGICPVELVARSTEEEAQSAFELEVIGAVLPRQELLYTQWFYADCIADYYQVPVYSDRHWELIGAYLETAAAHGINMVLTPIFTPPLDTEVGKERTCVQLALITKEGDRYSFDFSLVQKFIALAQSKGITHFEISHLFTQWGAGFAPAVYVMENGVRARKFGWDTAADSPAYAGFLAQFLPAFTTFLREQGLAQNVMFHISDEPEEKHLHSYRKAKAVAEPFLQGFPVRDALSDYHFYETGLVSAPIVATDHMEPFQEHEVPGLWAYNCCGQNVDVGNRFLAMPSYRNRILGLQLYKYKIAGFLHWGYNFYNLQNSRGQIDPYRVTDAGRAFPGGDPFSVYPGPDGALASLHLKVFHHGLQDLRALSLLERLGGREAAEQAVEDFAALTWKSYPRKAAYLLQMRETVNQLIKQKTREEKPAPR